MGGVDVIPGVSGGTMALVLGIYDRLVVALSHFDRRLLRHVLRREWTAAARHLDVGFLLPLGFGISAGVLSLASAMHWLLLHHPQETNATFFGLILGSSVLVARMVPRWKPGTIAALVAGALFAFWLVGLKALQDPPAGLPYLFFCGAVAICAMILPGISGSFILLLLGRYVHVTGLVRQLLHREFTVRLLLEVTVFTLGCVVGLLAFSRLLRWLLATHASVTTAALCGFMVGSLRKLWPFTEASEMSAGQTLLLSGLALGAALLVLALDALSRRRRA